MDLILILVVMVTFIASIFVAGYNDKPTRTK